MYNFDEVSKKTPNLKSVHFLLGALGLHGFKCFSKKDYHNNKRGVI